MLLIKLIFLIECWIFVHNFEYFTAKSQILKYCHNWYKEAIALSEGLFMITTSLLFYILWIFKWNMIAIAYYFKLFMTLYWDFIQTLLLFLVRF